jgi:hypothetical protein
MTVHPPSSTPHKGPWRHGRRCKKIATNGEDGELIEEVNAYLGDILGAGAEETRSGNKIQRKAKNPPSKIHLARAEGHESRPVSHDGATK